MSDLLYKVALTRIPKVGPVTVRNLLAYCGEPAEVFAARPKSLRHIPGVGEETARRIRSGEALRLAERELEYLEQHAIQTLFYRDDNFPERLRRLDNGPVLLYYKGSASLNHVRTLGIVGTRKPTVWGVSATERLLEELQSYDPLIVSGMAYGVDIVSHRAALGAGLETVGVLGHGLGQIYPATHERTARQMLEQGGLLSEYPFSMSPEREHFPMRNRIVAGLCDAVLVVESPSKGGSMITAEFANAYHREVLALPGRPHDRASAGCNSLIKTHRASLVESAKDIALALGWKTDGPSPRQQLALFAELTEEEKIIVALLRAQEKVHIDRLVVESQLPHGMVAAILLELECQGLVGQMPGKQYVLLK